MPGEIEKAIVKLAPYIRFLADCMALKDYGIDVEYDPNLTDAYAAVHVVDGRKRAVIFIGKNLLEQDEEGKRHSLVHELIHLHMKPIRLSLVGLDSYIGSVAYSMIEKAHDRAEEYSVDGIADGWAKVLPTFSEWARTQEL